MKNQILYVEDEEAIRRVARRRLQSAFPNMQTLDAEDRDSVDELIKNQVITADTLAVVCTDGKLGNDTTGWDVVERLRSIGYSGPAIYTGVSILPFSKEHLYVGRCDKIGGDLIEAVRSYMQSEQ